MRIYQALHSIVVKFAPMPENEEVELLSHSRAEYDKIRISMESKFLLNKQADAEDAKSAGTAGYVKKQRQSLSLQEKVVEFLELWYVRYFIAILYIIVVPRLQFFITNVGGGDKEETAEDRLISMLLERKLSEKQR